MGVCGLGPRTPFAFRPAFEPRDHARLRTGAADRSIERSTMSRELTCLPCTGETILAFVIGAVVILGAVALIVAAVKRRRGTVDVPKRGKHGSE